MDAIMFWYCVYIVFLYAVVRFYYQISADSEVNKIHEISWVVTTRDVYRPYRERSNNFYKFDVGRIFASV